MRPTGTVRVTLCINEVDYVANPLRPDVSIGVKGWKLRKADGTCYHIVHGPHGAECECGDFVFRKVNTGVPCKHIAALVAATLLPESTATKPIARPGRLCEAEFA